MTFNCGRSLSNSFSNAAITSLLVNVKSTLNFENLSRCFYSAFCISPCIKYMPPTYSIISFIWSTSISSSLTTNWVSSLSILLSSFFTSSATTNYLLLYLVLFFELNAILSYDVWLSTKNSSNRVSICSCWSRYCLNFSSLNLFLNVYARWLSFWKATCSFNNGWRSFITKRWVYPCALKPSKDCEGVGI